MAGHDVPDDDMDENLFPFHRREPAMPLNDAEKLLRGEPPTPDAAPEVHAVADVLGALCLPASAGELAGEKAAVAVFAAAMKEKALALAEPRRRPVLSALTGAKLAVAAVVGSLALGGVAAAAVTGSLPGPFQDVAHTLGAPGAQPDGSASDEPTESDEPTATATASPSLSGTHDPGDGHRLGHGPSAFAVCWFVVHKTGGIARTDRTDGTDGTDAIDHGRGEWSQAYAKIQAAAAASGQTVVQYCTALLASHSTDPRPTKSHTGDKHKGGSNDQGQGSNDQGQNNQGSQDGSGSHRGSDGGSGHGGQGASHGGDGAQRGGPGSGH